MNRRKLRFINRVVGWGFLLGIGSLILLFGYRSAQTHFSQGNKQITTKKMAKIGSTQEQPSAVQIGEVSPGEEKVRNASMGISVKESPGEESLSIKNFPSPVRGKITRDIGNYYSDNLAVYLFHAGTDYAEPEGTIIRATHGGKVVSAGPDLILGQEVTLDCGEGWKITYGGLDNLRVQAGDMVESQDLLGQVGFLPGADGIGGQSQLHYEIWQGDKVQKPVQEI